MRALPSDYTALRKGTTILLVCFGFGLVIGLALPSYGSPGGGIWQALADPVVFLLGLFWMYPITIAHEGGHMIAGWLVGFSFHHCYLGPLTITRTSRGVRLGWDKKKIGSGGVASYPRDDQHLRLRVAIFSAGGALVNLLLAALAVWLWYTLLSSCCATAAAPTLTSQLLVSLAFFSALTALGALVPLSIEEHTSDGLRLLRLIQGGQKSKREVLGLQLNRCILTGVWPRDWPSAQVLLRIALAQGRDDEHAGCIIAYYWAVDTGDIPGAGAFLDRALATLPRPAKPNPELALEATYFEARYRSHFAAARMWMNRSQGSRFDRVLRPRAETAILLGEGRYEEALAYAALGLAAWEHLAYLEPSGLRMEEESLSEMTTWAQQARAGVLV